MWEADQGSTGCPGGVRLPLSGRSGTARPSRDLRGEEGGPALEPTPTFVGRPGGSPSASCTWNGREGGVCGRVPSAKDDSPARPADEGVVCRHVPSAKDDYPPPSSRAAQSVSVCCAGPYALRCGGGTHSPRHRLISEEGTHSPPPALCTRPPPGRAAWRRPRWSR